MPLVTTPALIVHVMPYSETSKIVRLLARDVGLQSAIAKGARRPKSRTGPRLDLFAAGAATLLMKPHRELNLLTAFEVTAAHGGLAGTVERFAAASALAELALRFAPAEPLAELHDVVAAGLEALERAPPALVGSLALVACWSVVVTLGFAPTLDRCVVCGSRLDGAVAFSSAQGGSLCATHRRGVKTAKLRDTDRAALEAMIGGRPPEVPLDARHAAAHRRLLLAFVRQHLAEQQPMPALAFWDAESWIGTSS
jgi:DNA repair protein RecO (recombination protein O)